MPVTRNTALLVIHGIGQQSPYETLDSFARGIIRHLGPEYNFAHHLRKQKNEQEYNKKGSYIRASEKENPNGKYLDIYEYYWANITEKKITPAEVGQWVSDTLNATAKFGAEFHAQINQHNYSLDDQSLDPGYGNKRYHFRMKQIKHAVTFFRLFYSVLLFLIPKFSFTKRLTDWIKKQAATVITDFVGDVAIYTTMDVKSKHYLHRKQILSGAIEQAKSLIEDDGYEQVIISGHSLGSVIAFDVMNKLNIHANLNPFFAEKLSKIKGLVTFGSPLDKIAFFFRDQVTKEAFVRLEILNDLHCFKVKKEFLPEANKIKPGVKRMMEQVLWTNYFHMQDPVSGRLDYYHCENKLCHFNNSYDKFGIAHVGYWNYAPLYADICKNFT